MSTETEFLSAYEQIVSAYAQTMTKVENAIGLEEREQPKKAIAAYEVCVKTIEEIFAIPVGLPENIETVDTQWADACKKIQTLKNVKTEIIYRLKVLRAKHLEAVEANEEMSSSSNRNTLPGNSQTTTQYDIKTASGQTKTFKEIIAGLREVMATKESGVLFDTLFSARSKLYKIKENGEVITISGATNMSLVMCTIGGKWQYLNGIYFLQFTMPDKQQQQQQQESNSLYPVLELSNAQNDMIWLYPLIPNVTKGFRTDYGAIILPDLESQNVGDAFGIMVLEATTIHMITEAPTTSAQAAANATTAIRDQRQFFLDLLEGVLSGRLQDIYEFETQGPKEDNLYDTSYKISKTIVNTADFIAKNLIRGAQKSGEIMISATPYITSKLEPASETAGVSYAVQKTAEIASTVTVVAASATGWVATKVGYATSAIGQYLAPHIHKQGVNILEKVGYDSAEANEKMEGAFRVAAGAIEGFSTVKNGMETSATILGKNLSENSVKIIEYKYGTAAGDVANDTFDTIGNCFIVTRNVNNIGPKSFAKNVAKKSGKAIVDDYRRDLHDDKNFISAGNLYPDLRAAKDALME